MYSYKALQNMMILNFQKFCKAFPKYDESMEEI